MKRFLDGFLRDSRGATAMEYALIGGLIALSIIAGSQIIGTKLSSYFPQISNNLP
jgi:pilus assembly protein Flp/PilA